MPSTPINEDMATGTQVADERSIESAAGSLLVCLPSVAAEGLHIVLDHIAAAMPDRDVLIASPGGGGTDSPPHLKMLDYVVPERGEESWALTARDYHGSSQLALQHNVAATLVLGAEAASLSSSGLQALVNAVLGGADLAMPRYEMGPHEALVSSGLLYPLSQALFRADVHLPLPLDVAFSPRMANRLSAAAHRPRVGSDNEPLLWPVAEAAVAGLVVREIDAGARTLPHPSDSNLNALLAGVAGSLFSDIEVKASFWQRARAATPASSSKESTLPAPAGELDGLQSMVEEFRNAYTNLQEIWSLVLPPQSLLGLKRVSRMPPETFEIAPDLWARTVYDFVLAYHARTINRGHLLGAFTPLYLAWVASHLRRSADDARLASAHVEETASAFVAEKPYLVARWRWPDRFNP